MTSHVEVMASMTCRHLCGGIVQRHIVEKNLMISRNGTFAGKVVLYNGESYKVS